MSNEDRKAELTREIEELKSAISQAVDAGDYKSVQAYSATMASHLEELAKLNPTTPAKPTEPAKEDEAPKVKLVDLIPAFRVFKVRTRTAGRERTIAAHEVQWSSERSAIFLDYVVIESLGQLKTAIRHVMTDVDEVEEVTPVATQPSITVM